MCDYLLPGESATYLAEGRQTNDLIEKIEALETFRFHLLYESSSNKAPMSCECPKCKPDLYPSNIWELMYPD